MGLTMAKTILEMKNKSGELRLLISGLDQYSVVPVKYAYRSME